MNRQAAKVPNALRPDIAKAAHAIWRERMIKDGWQPGDRTDPEAKVHTWLCPFENLSPLVRDRIAEWLDSIEIAATLSDCVRNAASDQSLSTHDLKIGALVRLSTRPEPDADYEDPVGRIKAWETVRPGSGIINSITVTWPNGDTSDYAADDLELVASTPAEA